MATFAAVLGAYLIGSLPIAYLLCRAKGVDIFAVGTGNPGAANVFRTVGPAAAGLVLAGDLLKGVAAVTLARVAGQPAEVVLLAGGVAVVGHWYPVLLRFRGGAGLATLVGVGAAVLPLPALVGAAFAIPLLLRFRSTGHAAALGFLVFLLVAAAQDRLAEGAAVAAMGVLVLLHSVLVVRRRELRGRSW